MTHADRRRRSSSRRGGATTGRRAGAEPSASPPARGGAHRRPSGLAPLPATARRRARPRAVAWVLLAVAAVAGGCGGATPPGAGGTGGERRPLWKWTAPRPSYVGIPAADAAGAAVTYGHSHVVVLDGSGRPLWTADGAHLRDVAPSLSADTVAVPTEEGVVAFDRASGAVRWAAALGERANTPVAAGDRLVVSTWQGSLVGIEPSRGTVVWRAALPGPALGAAAAGGGVVTASWSSDDGRAGIVAVDPADGRARWAAALPGGGTSGPGVVAARDGGAAFVVVVAGDVAAHALAVDSGTERWRTPLEGAGSPEVAPLDAGDGDVAVADRLGGMALLATADGRPGWRTSTDGAAVRGGPAGPGPGRTFALPLDDGRVVVAGPGRHARFLSPPGRASGVAAGPAATLLVATREAPDNDLTAWPW